jgi:hypothetical protein
MHLGKASVALANKIARILWALWTKERTFWRRLRPAGSVAGPGTLHPRGRIYVCIRCPSSPVQINALALRREESI